MNAYNKLEVRSSPLQLDGYFLKSLSFSISEVFEKERLNTLFLSTGLHPQLGEPLSEARPYFNISFKIGADNDDPLKYKCSLAVKSTEDLAQPYTFEAAVVAFFTWKPETKDNPKIDQAVQSTAINIMYSLLREALASATGRSPLPALVLPSALFKFYNEEIDSSKTTSRKKALSSKKKFVK